MSRKRLARMPEVVRLQKRIMSISKKGNPKTIWSTIVLTQDKSIYIRAKPTDQPCLSTFNNSRYWTLIGNIGSIGVNAYISNKLLEDWQVVNQRDIEQNTLTVPTLPEYNKLPPEDLRLVITGPARLLKKLNKKIRKDGN